MSEYKSPLNAYGLKVINTPGLGEKLSDLLHISSAIIVPGSTATVITSGQTGYNANMQYPSDLGEEIMNAFQSIEDSLIAAGAKDGFRAVFRMTSYHTSMGDDVMEALDKAAGKFFGANRPAWAGVGVAELYGGARIEIAVEAALSGQ